MTIKTKYGIAKINDNGYYVITSRKEGNNGKRLHRLVFEDYHDCKLDKSDVIHHIDGDKTNNHPTNLICMSRKAHGLLHNKDRKFSEESKKKMSEVKKGKYCGENNPMYGKKRPDLTKRNLENNPCKSGENHWKYVELPDDLLNEYNESNCTAQQLADKYGVSRSTIFRRLKNAKSKK